MLTHRGKVEIHLVPFIFRWAFIKRSGIHTNTFLGQRKEKKAPSDEGACFLFFCRAGDGHEGLHHMVQSPGGGGVRRLVVDLLALPAADDEACRLQLF